MKRYHSLKKEEEKILWHKGTEAPGSGEFDLSREEGMYICKQCDFPLFLSDNKFPSGCGWPSFDEEIEGHVAYLLDRDGLREEIVCARCEAHLGHVFKGERFTDKNVRHCVNSQSMQFIRATTKEGNTISYLAGGCFWGVEYYLKKLPGVKEVHVGYMGGEVVNPSYEEVCTGKTGHLEVVEVIFEEAVLSLKDLYKFFLEIHDPFQVNGQGPDVGFQYQSAIFYLTKKEQEVAFEVLSFLKKAATLVLPASRFYRAEAYHQDYYTKTGKEPYCHIYTKRF